MRLSGSVGSSVPQSAGAPNQGADSLLSDDHNSVSDGAAHPDEHNQEVQKPGSLLK